MVGLLTRERIKLLLFGQILRPNPSFLPKSEYPVIQRAFHADITASLLGFQPFVPLDHT